jgi:hypothetical protein
VAWIPGPWQRKIPQWIGRIFTTFFEMNPEGFLEEQDYCITQADLRATVDFLCLEKETKRGQRMHQFWAPTIVSSCSKSFATSRMFRTLRKRLGSGIDRGGPKATSGCTTSGAHYYGLSTDLFLVDAHHWSAHGHSFADAGIVFQNLIMVQ